MTTRSNAAVIILAFAVVSCAVYEKKQTVEGDQAIVAAYVNAWNQRDTVALDSLLAPDGVHEDVAQNFRGRGPKQVIAFMRRELSAEPDFKWTVTNSLEDGRVVALEWTWTASYTGPDPTGKPVTNRRISGKGTSVAEVEDGKIKRFTDYYDMASFFR
ncbi:MAG TPA: nuclear transport factor 2 family protein [Gemmatimonadaceae bacterium]